MKNLAASLKATRRQNCKGMVKTCEDVSRYEVLIDRVHPAAVLECGTFSGRSALWFAETAGCSVVTIDIDPQVSDETRDEWAGRVTLVIGDTVSPNTVAYVHRCLAGVAPLLAVLDSDHSEAHVVAELEAYTSLVSVGSYCVVEDTLLAWMDAAEQVHYRGTPLGAVQAWLLEHAGWEADTELEDLFEVTQHPAGWLRRVA